MFALEYDDSILIVDCGLMFPDDEMFGIDFVSPTSPILKREKKIVGIITGHEDHMGGFLHPPENPAPLQDELTLGMVGQALRMGRLHPATGGAGGRRVRWAPFSVQFIAVCHSVPTVSPWPSRLPWDRGPPELQARPHPIDGRLTDYAAFSEEGRRRPPSAVGLHQCGAPRFRQSEHTLSGTIDRLFRQHRSRRIVISAFASNLHQVQQVVDAAARFRRKVALVGRSMVKNVELAGSWATFTQDEKTIVDIEDISKVPRFAGGHDHGQPGEPFPALSS